MSITFDKHDKYPESILIRNFIGEVNIDDIISSWEYLCLNKKKYKNTKGVINNLSKCELVMDLESFKALINYLKKQDFIKDKKLAVVTNNPEIIIFPYMGEQNEQGLQIKPFSTEEAAVKWIIL